MDIKLRFATVEDTALILDFIKEFARFQKNVDTVSATEESLRKWMFEEGKAEAIFALDGETEIGFALFNHSFSAHQGKPALFLECIFVREEYRSDGVGHALIREIAKTCIERDWVRIEANSPDWNAASMKFYNKIGFEEMNGWTHYRIGKDSLADVAAGKLPQFDD